MRPAALTPHLPPKHPTIPERKETPPRVTFSFEGTTPPPVALSFEGTTRQIPPRVTLSFDLTRLRLAEIWWRGHK